MAHSDGSDVLPAELQLDMFGAPPTTSHPDSAAVDSPAVSAELADALAKVRAAPGAPSSSDDAAHLRDILARMAEGLPSDEAAQLRLELDSEPARLTAA
jgi:hypothetical protein